MICSLVSRLRSSVCTLSLLGLLVPGLAFGQTPGEVRADIDPGSYQSSPVVALSNHAGVAVWQERFTGLVARSLDATGQPTGAVTTLVAADEVPVPFRGRVFLPKDPSVVITNSGERLVTWTRDRLAMSVDFFYQDETLLEQDVFVQRFNAAGEALTRPQLLSTSREGFQYSSVIVPASSSRFLVGFLEQDEPGAEHEGRVSVRMINRRGHDVAPDGLALKSEPVGLRDVRSLRGALSANGEQALFVFSACCDENSDRGVFGQFFKLDRNGVTAQGGAFQISTRSQGTQGVPDVVAEGDEDFLVVWHGPTGKTTGRYPERRIFGQVVGASGALLGPELRISNGEGWGHDRPRLARAKNGQRMVVWRFFRGDLPSGIQAARIGAGGASGAGFVINEKRALEEGAFIGAGRNGFVATWIGVADRERAVQVRALPE